jgi:hypothetical protein
MGLALVFALGQAGRGGATVLALAPGGSEETIYLPVISKPTCKVPVYQDDFSDASSGWPVQPNSLALAEYLDGEYRLKMDLPHNRIGVAPGVRMSDGTVAADMRMPTGVLGAYGLLFGISDDGSAYYMFHVRPNGTYMIIRWEHYGSAAVIPAGGQTDVLAPTGEANHLEVVRTGARIQASINGRALIDTQDDAMMGSLRVGLMVVAFDWTNVDGRFDNFTVTPLNCPSASAVGDRASLPGMPAELLGAR